MSEWAVPAQYPQQRQMAAQPEWYSAGGTAQYASTSYNSYDMPGGGQSSGAAYGSFEDEAPLLEGVAPPAALQGIAVTGVQREGDQQAGRMLFGTGVPSGGGAAPPDLPTRPPPLPTHWPPLPAPMPCSPSACLQSWASTSPPSSAAPAAS
jgi:hypothetical protein